MVGLPVLRGRVRSVYPIIWSLIGVDFACQTSIRLRAMDLKFAWPVW